MKKHMKTYHLQNPPKQKRVKALHKKLEIMNEDLSLHDTSEDEEDDETETLQETANILNSTTVEITQQRDLPTIEDVTHICPHCGQSFEEKTEFQEHIKSTHNTLTTTETWIFECF